MRWNRSSLLLIVIVASVISGCGVPEPVPATRASRVLDPVEFKDADPVADLCSALEAGGTTFLGMTEFASFVPGAEDRPDLTSKHGVRYVPGISDTSDKLLADSVFDYCEIYNQLLKRHLLQQAERSTLKKANRSVDAIRWDGADPVADLRTARKAGDTRFLGLQPWGEFIPGAENNPDLTSKYGVRYVVGVSDTSEQRIKDSALEYCTTYNLLLRRQLRREGRARGTTETSAAAH